MNMQQQQQLEHQRQQMEDLPPGFRFHPTDQELITFYLVNKVVDREFCANAIGEVDLNKSEPWELPNKATMGEKEWYFYCHKDRKYPTGMRTNRATDAGYWKATGKDKEIFGSDQLPDVVPALIGMKKTLVFYRGRAPRGEKTNWVMHEYRLDGETLPLPVPYPPNAINPAKDEWVVCRIFHKSSGIKKVPYGAMDEQMRMAMSIPMPIPAEQQGFPLNPAAFMDASSMYATSSIATAASSYQMPSMGNYFGNNQQQQVQPSMFYQQPQMAQMGAGQGFMVADPASAPTSMVSNDDATVLNNNGAAAAAAAEISSVDMAGMDGMWKY